MAEHGYKHIGILGGMAPPATVDLYSQIIEQHDQLFQDDYYPEMTIRNINPGYLFNVLDTEPLDRAAVVAELIPHLESLSRTQADFIVIAANSPHVVLPELQDSISVPIRSIVDATRDAAVAMQADHPLLFGTGITMTDGFFHRPFQEAGIELVTPDETDQKMINSIISHKLFGEGPGRLLLQALQKYACNSVILGCTELPQLIKQDDVAVPMLDTVAIQAKDTLVEALS